MAWRDKADPYEVFSDWVALAKNDLEAPYRNAFTLCTTGADGTPNGRTVLLRDHTLKDKNGNYVLVWLAPDMGVKATEIDQSGKAAAVFLWATKNYIHHESVSGTVSKASREVSEKYFNQLPREFQIGVSICEQDQPIPSVSVLDDKFQEAQIQRFPDNQPIPCPSFYHAYLLHPLSYEFYEGGDIMIHNLRVKYTTIEGKEWKKTLLTP